MPQFFTTKKVAINIISLIPITYLLSHSLSLSANLIFERINHARKIAKYIFIIFSESQCVYLYENIVS